MAGLITFILATSFTILSVHFSPVTATFYIETLRQNENEDGVMFRCPVRDVVTNHIVRQLSPSYREHLMEQRRLGLEAGVPEDDGYIVDDSPPNPQAPRLSFTSYLDPPDTQTKPFLQTRGLNMRGAKASLHAWSHFAFGCRATSKSVASSRPSQGSSRGQPTTKTKGLPQGISSLNLPSLVEKLTKPQSSPKPDDLPPAARKPQNFFCLPILSHEEVAEVHARVNFYLVAYPRLAEGKSIVLPDMETPFSFLLGVPLLEEEPDWPAFIDGHKDDVAVIVALVRQMFVNLVQPPLLMGLSVDSLATLMSTANFRHFSRPVPKMVKNYKAFAELQANVEKYCGTTRTSDNEIIPPEDSKKLEAAKSAIRVLVQKMIDPCFMGAEGWKKDSQGAKDADSLCNEHCKFLAVSFAVFPNAVDKPDGCSSAILSGHCDSKPSVCTCMQVSGSDDQRGKPHLVPMIKCSNILRRNILPPIFVFDPREESGEDFMKWT